jgi:hypothetical protein
VIGAQFISDRNVVQWNQQGGYWLGAAGFCCNAAIRSLVALAKGDAREGLHWHGDPIRQVPGVKQSLKTIALIV